MLPQRNKKITASLAFFPLPARIIFMAIVFMGGAVLLVRLVRHFSEPTSFFNLSYLEKEKYIDDLIKKEGALVARDFIIKSYPHEENIGHHLFHRVGVGLYYQFGEDAFSYCGDSFGYGCFHGAVVGYVRAHGMNQETIEAFVKKGCGEIALFEKASACFHGVGHALFDLFGVLGNTLDVCKKIAPQKYAQACYLGTVMEYVMGSFRQDTREGYIAERDPYIVCHALNKDYRDACYQEHVAYILTDRYPGQWDKAADYCRGIPDADQGIIMRCGKRIGIAVNGLVTADIDRGWELCREAGNLKTACAYGFVEQRIVQKDFKSANQVCNLFSLAEQPACNQNMKIFIDSMQQRQISH